MSFINFCTVIDMQTIKKPITEVQLSKLALSLKTTIIITNIKYDLKIFIESIHN